MRFQQLKHDPNSVMRKKLVKSKKNWVVVSSLSIAGGLLLLGAPTTVSVKADVAPINTVLTEQSPTKPKAAEPTTAGSTSTDAKAGSDDVVAPKADGVNTPKTVVASDAGQTDGTKTTVVENPVEAPVAGSDVQAPVENKAIVSDETTKVDTPVVNKDSVSCFRC